jgi:hypothetical protein
MKSAISCAAFLLIVCGAFAALWGWDVWQDRKHTVTVLTESPVFAGGGNELCDVSQLAVVKEGAVFKAKRIRYWKNCATVDVVLADGRKGYFVLGVGHVSVDPPLQ